MHKPTILPCFFHIKRFKNLYAVVCNYITNIQKCSELSDRHLPIFLFIATNVNSWRITCRKSNECCGLSTYFHPGITDNDPFWLGYGPILSASTDLGNSSIKVAEKLVTWSGGFNSSLGQCKTVSVLSSPDSSGVFSAVYRSCKWTLDEMDDLKKVSPLSGILDQESHL